MDKNFWETVHWFAFFFVVGGLLLIILNNSGNFKTLVGTGTTAYASIEAATKDFTIPTTKASA